MLDALLAHVRALGCRDAWVLTDRPNPPAKRLYESAVAVAEPSGGKLYVFDLNAATLP